MKTEVYTIAQLKNYIETPKYRENDILPVSPERVASYIRNPRAKPDLPVLFLLREDDEILAYRTLLPDYFMGENGPTPFAWLSGNYVSPNHRRKGLSTLLFKTVEEAWGGKLMYTNYAPESKAVYDKLNAFHMFRERPGRRYYLRSSLKVLLGGRIKSAGLLEFGDKLINGIHDPGLKTDHFRLPDGISAIQKEVLDPGLKEFISEQSSASLFRRGPIEFKWIRDWPWVSEKPAISLAGSYQFTREVEKFRNKIFELKSNKGTAFLWISIINSKAAVPYFYSNDPILAVAARQLVLEEMIAEECAYLTIRHPELGPIMGTRKNPFLFSRSMPQRYFCHNSLKDLIRQELKIQDGDGDCIFS